MNYLQEIKSFNHWLLWNSKKMTTASIALWYAIMATGEENGASTEFTIGNETLQSLAGLGRQGLNDARNRLIQLQRISYKKKSGSCAGTYKILTFNCTNLDTTLDTNTYTNTYTNTDKVEKSSKKSDATLYKINTKNKKERENVVAIAPTHPLALFVQVNFSHVSKLPKQLTDVECEKLLSDFKKEEIKAVLLDMENYKPLLQKSQSVYLTIRKWISRDKERKNGGSTLIHTAQGVTAPPPNLR